MLGGVKRAAFSLIALLLAPATFAVTLTVGNLETHQYESVQAAIDGTGREHCDARARQQTAHEGGSCRVVEEKISGGRRWLAPLTVQPPKCGISVFL